MTGFHRAGIVTQPALSAPQANMALDGRDFDRRVGARRRAIANTRPDDQQAFGLEFETGAKSVGAAC
jgi:hypothetical protein